MAPHSRIQSPGRSDALCCCGWPHALCCLLDCRLATLEVRSNRPARWPDSNCRCVTQCGPGGEPTGAQPISRGVSCIRADTCWTVCLKSSESNSCRLSPKSPKPSLLSKSRSQSSCIRYGGFASTAYSFSSVQSRFVIVSCPFTWMLLVSSWFFSLLTDLFLYRVLPRPLACSVLNKTSSLSEVSLEKEKARSKKAAGTNMSLSF